MRLLPICSLGITPISKEVVFIIPTLLTLTLVLILVLEITYATYMDTKRRI